ncbi:potassium-transporting ATPase subunit KdpC [Siccirubricoccus sp. KC 17139]|uniref:Potassium-transporting ATPase KdpC subunit n=1 Tax=Siccirubricoccus soli TaxID=2899147 RepID=A0ABT1D7H6_9PROT|nr:potassium-transporting ATPase subunit KdpC [Siccirubricoccus soli]MCO6417878.1 potassium-transporting ATPase subunit KdpC [Siccirubricoccus soli]MCP2684013.1 potassium-transporting ATPase subunit KdpC [Siccirubricoccus soli]
MIAILRPALAVVGLLTLLLGLAVPLGFTGLAGTLFPTAAGGSLIERDGKVVGSALIGQDFTADRYFHPRPSATTAPDPEKPGSTIAAPYNAAASAASQAAPTSQALLEAVKERQAVLGGGAVPADAVTASGSGLDPHISPENAGRQVARVAAARGLPAAQVAALVERQTEGRELGLLGERRVNVLRLNLALDALR